MPRNKHIWCIRKYAPCRAKPNNDSPIVDIVKFGQQMTVLKLQSNVPEGWYRVVYRGRLLSIHGKRVQTHGYICSQAVTEDRVTDYARLCYTNRMGQRIPVAMAYHGKRTGWIEPDETVQVIARAGDWCITDKGWTKYSWLQKNRDINSAETLNLVYISVVGRAMQDYRTAVKRLRKGKYTDEMNKKLLLLRVKEIEDYFLGENYAIQASFTPITGEEILQHLKDELGVDEAWEKEQKRQYKLLTRKRKR